MRIDPFDETSWPDSFTRLVTGFGSDSAIVDYCNSACFDDDFSAVAIVVFHGTRLLPTEIENVLAAGLQVTSAQLLNEKVRRAQETYPDAFGAGEVDQLLASSPLSRRPQGRVDQIWFLAPIEVFNARYSSVFLSSWGGEIVYWSDPDLKCHDKLRGLSEPVLFRCAVPAPGIARHHRPRLLRTMRRTLDLDTFGMGSDQLEFLVRHELLGDAILELIKPGHKNWPITDDVLDDDNHVTRRRERRTREERNLLAALFRNHPEAIIKMDAILDGDLDVHEREEAFQNLLVEYE